VNQQGLPVKQHIVELRKRLTWAVLSVVICTALAFVFHQQILTLLMEPARGFSSIPNEKPIYTEMTEYLGIAMKVSLLAGLVLASPFVLLQLGLFVSPGLKPVERRYLFAMLPISFAAFILGAVFGYRILFPPAVKFLLTFGGDIATPYIRIGNYTNLMLTLLFWMGIVFQTPVVLYFLSKIGVVSYQLLSKWRKYAIVVAFILGAVITPTFDPINQTIVALPIIVLYELGIWLSRLGGRNKTDTEEKAE
tara:strand:- start:301 stop:1050 length:750 start_codon:yes stop_codon:yes gene_type:complete